MPEPLTLEPIGTVSSRVAEPVDDVWGGLRSSILLDASRFSADCLAGLDQFSHVDVVFHFHLVDESKIHTGARHPRGRSDWPLAGIFAQRAKNRPNRLGVTTCKLIAVRGLTLEVEGLDAIDGTPVLDLKPCMREFLPSADAVRQPDWSSELMRDYWNRLPE